MFDIQSAVTAYQHKLRFVALHGANDYHLRNSEYKLEFSNDFPAATGVVEAKLIDQHQLLGHSVNFQSL